MNKAILIGNLGNDPTSRTTGNGKQVAEFNLATQGGANRDPDWHRIVCFEKQAEQVTKYLSKGSKVAVEGRIQTRSYEKDGQKRYVTEIVAFNVEFLSAKREEPADEGEDDLP